MGLLVFLLIGFFIVTSISWLDYNDETNRKKREKENHISWVKSRITGEFDLLIEYPTKESIEGLEHYLDKLKKIATDSSFTKHIKPYDELYAGSINRRSALHDRFKIMIDKNLTPKFAPDVYYTFENKKDMDYELEACMDANELEKFIDRCKMALMNKEIEAHRKKIIEDKLK
jgi:hypothetical protein